MELKEKLVFMKGLLKTTGYFRNYWKNRKIDWHQSYFNVDHPHRDVIVEKLKRFRFKSVLEVGCAAGANLYKIKKAFPWTDIGGIDWNADAIEEAKRMLPGISVLQQGEASDIYISDKGADILMSDMCLIYMDKSNFHKAIREAKRVARNGVLFCEFHEPSWIKRILIKLVKGYNAYDYRKILKKYGFHDIQVYKLTDEEWPGAEAEGRIRCIITAKS